ncbi:phosphoribosyl-AMP cyclohydrolase [Tunicatimonas pelagia]|uniref:phosphoribosyl-AMP cyclohydrolase n=1 Tax=Tunicatimonas pelagia TaxID=931531 RepID=UPI0026658242|nr:phosphoribosyl-AMP cyclohydrolase [Tunicatimonas pelagia]WKN40884.1 phosphoribosyl-AMP cyclohydrolase [Tunicatimonas pelagia]
MNQLEEGTELLLQFEKRGGLLPVVVQEKYSGEVLMIGYANQEALQHSIKTRYATFWSTSRQELWTKGQTSGDRLRISDIRVDCDQDALLYQVVLEGEGVCHTKTNEGQTRKACFYRKIDFDHQSLLFDQ